MRTPMLPGLPFSMFSFCLCLNLALWWKNLANNSPKLLGPQQTGAPDPVLVWKILTRTLTGLAWSGHPQVNPGWDEEEQFPENSTPRRQEC